MQVGGAGVVGYFDDVTTDVEVLAVKGLTDVADKLEEVRSWESFKGVENIWDGCVTWTTICDYG